MDEKWAKKAAEQIGVPPGETIVMTHSQTPSHQHGGGKSGEPHSDAWAATRDEKGNLTVEKLHSDE